MENTTMGPPFMRYVCHAMDMSGQNKKNLLHQSFQRQRMYRIAQHYSQASWFVTLALKLMNNNLDIHV